MFYNGFAIKSHRAEQWVVSCSVHRIADVLLKACTASKHLPNSGRTMKLCVVRLTLSRSHRIC